MNDNVRIVTVDATNVEQEGFFCYKSKPKSEGYRYLGRSELKRLDEMLAARGI